MYGATLEALPSLADVLLVPSAIGLGLAIVAAIVFARRLGAGMVGLLVASWIAVLGSVAWIPLDGRAPPVTSVAIVDWLLVHLDWPTLVATLVALACVLAALWFEPARRTGLGIVGLWLAAHAAAGAIEHGGARMGWSPPVGAAASLAIYAASAAMITALARGAPRAPIPAAWIPSALVLLLGPPAMIRGALEPGLEIATALDERIEAGELDPWRADAAPGDLVPDDVLVVLANGGLLAVDRGGARMLAPGEAWAPEATAQVARIIPEKDVTAAQLLDAVRRVGTHRVALAALDHTPTFSLLAAISTRAAVHRVAIVPVDLVLYPMPLPLGFEPCVDLRAVPADEPLEPHVRGVNCVANVSFAAHAAPPPRPPPRPWLPSRPAWPPLLLLAIAISIAWRWWRPGGRPVYVVAFTVAALFAGAATFRAVSGA